jgi:predicted RNA-binding Zn-ribbon protein involved in translation (DUF1610 family)
MEDQRKAICESCDKLVKGLINTCDSCGCIIAIMVKIENKKCPEGKW